jgi:opacity protein-like surface antigen
LVYHATERLSVELAGALFGDELQVPLADRSLRFTGDTNFDNQTVWLSARYAYPLTHALAVYGGAGISYYRFDPDPQHVLVDSETLDEGFFVTSAPLDINADDEFGFHAAVGLQAALTRNIELFGEYRYIFIDRTVELAATVNTRRETITVEQTETGPGAETVSVREQTFGASDTVSGSYDHGMFRVGLNFYF